MTTPDVTLIQKLARLTAQKALTEMRTDRAVLALAEWEYDALLHSLGWHDANGDSDAQDAIRERAVFAVCGELDAMIGGAR